MAVSQLVTSSPVTWSDIGGLESTKAEIKFALGVSVSQPPAGVKVQAFRNILFYGPPGTGKTLLAAATSNALTASGDRKAVFFNVKVSSVMSKYFGESTKIISELYGTARDQSPSVVFLDEFEALAQNRDDGENTGPERRILSTILAELDGLAEKGRSGIYVLTIAATNRPWDLDAAVLSRFEKKILIPLPDAETRRIILEIHLDRRGYAVQGFSGREIERFCKEAAGLMIMEMNKEIPSLLDRGFDALRNNRLKARPLSAADFERAAARVRPQTSAEDMRKYASWSEQMEEA
jgi:katanin p60 ATPase-containing subunit A1